MSHAKKLGAKAAKQARGGGQFLPFRLDVLRSPVLAGLSAHACKLLLDIASQWRLGRNGDASIAFEKVMRPRGWRSKATLYKALKELVASGLIIQTRQGSLHVCSLYALGWLAVDDCGGKLDIRPTTRPPDYWLEIGKPLLNRVSGTEDVPKIGKMDGVSTRSVPDG